MGRSPAESKEGKAVNTASIVTDRDSASTHRDLVDRDHPALTVGLKDDAIRAINE